MPPSEQPVMRMVVVVVGGAAASAEAARALPAVAGILCFALCCGAALVVFLA